MVFLWETQVLRTKGWLAEPDGYLAVSYTNNMFFLFFFFPKSQPCLPYFIFQMPISSKIERQKLWRCLCHVQNLALSSWDTLKWAAPSTYVQCPNGLLSYFRATQSFKVLQSALAQVQSTYFSFTIPHSFTSQSNRKIELLLIHCVWVPMRMLRAHSLFSTYLG